MLVLGGLLVAVSEQMPVWLVMACGLMFVIPGAVALVGWLRRDAADALTPLYPVMAVGSILLGAILLLFPASFVRVMMYVLSAFVMVASVSQIYALAARRRRGMAMSAWYAVPPLLMFGAALYVLFNPGMAAALPFILLGAACVLYGVQELLTVLLVARWRRRQPVAAEVPVAVAEEA